MSLKTILLVAQDPARIDRALSAVVPLARRDQAHILALAIMPPHIVVPGSEGMGGWPTIDEHRTAYRRDLTAMRQRIDDVGRGEAFTVEWRELDAGFEPVAGLVVQQARACDLVVLSQRKSAWPYSSLLEDPERIVLECGRPVLMIPDAGLIHLPPRRTLIAWNGSKEAARALFDALPLIGPESDVSVAWVDPPADRAGQTPGVDACAILSRHGHHAEAVQIRTTAGEAGDALAREARGRSADLIVMGAYGHARWRETVFGGASRFMFENLDRPVLMSH